MTVLYDASSLTLMGVITKWRGTMLPMVLNSAIFWSLTVLHVSLMLLEQYLTHSLDEPEGLPPIEYNKVATVMSL